MYQYDYNLIIYSEILPTSYNEVSAHWTSITFVSNHMYKQDLTWSMQDDFCNWSDNYLVTSSGKLKIKLMENYNDALSEMKSW